MFAGADVGEENMVAEQMNNIYKESPTIVIIYSTPKSQWCGKIHLLVSTNTSLRDRSNRGHGSDTEKETVDRKRRSRGGAIKIEGVQQRSKQGQRSRQVTERKCRAGTSR